MLSDYIIEVIDSKGEQICTYKASINDENFKSDRDRYILELKEKFPTASRFRFYKLILERIFYGIELSKKNNKDGK